MLVKHAFALYKGGVFKLFGDIDQTVLCIAAWKQQQLYMYAVCLLHSTQSGALSPKEDREEQSLSYAMLYAATAEYTYSPLEQHDFGDLPSFSYQISHGMVHNYSDKLCNE